MAKYRLLRGNHAEGFYPQGHALAGQAISYNPGDVIESNNNLLKYNAQMNQGVLGKSYLGNKFELVDEAHIQVTDKIGSQALNETQSQDSTSDGLDKMSLADLRKLAESDSVDLSQARTKPEVIAAIRVTYAAA